MNNTPRAHAAAREGHHDRRHPGTPRTAGADDASGHPRLRLRGRGDDHPGPDPLVHGLRRGVDRAHRRAGRHAARSPGSTPRRSRTPSTPPPTPPTWRASRTAPTSARVDEKDAGPTNNWMAPNEMKEIMRGLYAGCMKGRTMYVIPFVMGHLEADKPMFGVEITDSAYVTAVDARDGPHGHARAPPDGGARRRRRRRSCPRCTRSACRSRTARPTWRGRATTPSTSCSSPRSGPSGRSAPATAATRCWARSATPCASPA